MSDGGEKLRAERSEKIRQFAVSDANKLIYNDLVKLAQSGRNKK